MKASCQRHVSATLKVLLAGCLVALATGTADDLTRSSEAQIQELKSKDQAQAIQIAALQDSLQVALQINLQQISQFKSELQDQINAQVNQTKHELQNQIDRVKSSAHSDVTVDLMGSPNNVPYIGVEYRTLDGHSPNDTHTGGQTNVWVSMPVGWRVASYSAAVEHVIKSHGWGTACLFIDNGTALGTAANLAAGQMAQHCSGGDFSDFGYRPASTWGRPEQYRISRGLPSGSKFGFLICPISQCGTVTQTFAPTFAPTISPTAPIWTQSGDTFSGQGWQSITSSSDGTKLAAVVYYGSIWLSSDSGASWSEAPGQNGQNWQSITSSSDGTKLAAVANEGGSIWLSSDSGASWSEAPGTSEVPCQQWQSITSSSDGTKLAAVVSGCSIWLSSDSGASWSEAPGTSGQGWQSITSSSDGTKLAAADADGYSGGGGGGNIWLSSSSKLYLAPVPAGTGTGTAGRGSGFGSGNRREMDGAQ